VQDLLTVALEAHHAERNHHRRYAISVGRDLFGDWSVVIRYGRLGRGGQEEQFAGPQADELRAIVRDRLKRRLSAPKRLGAPYRLTVLSAAPGFDESSWLPATLMCKFGGKLDEDVDQGGGLDGA
jgi:predicted DNA-binding WGR domain protein